MNLESDDMRIASLNPGSSFGVGEVATPVVVTWNFASRKCFSAQHIQTSRGAEARICCMTLHIHSVSLVNIKQWLRTIYIYILIYRILELEHILSLTTA